MIQQTDQDDNTPLALLSLNNDTDPAVSFDSMPDRSITLESWVSAHQKKIEWWNGTSSSAQKAICEIVHDFLRLERVLHKLNGDANDDENLSLADIATHANRVETSIRLRIGGLELERRDLWNQLTALRKKSPQTSLFQWWGSNVNVQLSSQEREIRRRIDVISAEISNIEERASSTLKCIKQKLHLIYRLEDVRARLIRHIADASEKETNNLYYCAFSKELHFRVKCHDHQQNIDLILQLKCLVSKGLELVATSKKAYSPLADSFKIIVIPDSLIQEITNHILKLTPSLRRHFKNPNELNEILSKDSKLKSEVMLHSTEAILKKYNGVIRTYILPKAERALRYYREAWESEYRMVIHDIQELIRNNSGDDSDRVHDNPPKYFLE
jgi:hypothetical protein